ncbi:MAG: hypothetical protein IPK28_11460 [Devosia sp.]|nr:hypothetical protein [Devosia sp.]
MKTTALTLATLALCTGAALAAPPSAEQKADFYKTCMERGSEQLCSCKADAAMTLIDSDFMAIVIASMRGRSLDPKYAVAYNDYIVGSTRACGMGM